MTPPRHRPYLASGAAFEIGLRPLEMRSWLDVGADHARFMAAKRARLSGCPPLFYRTLERSRAAQGELLRMVASNLLAHHAAVFAGDDRMIVDQGDGTRHELRDEAREPLDLLGGLAEEDFVLFDKADGFDMVIAASNAYTSSGRIVSCVGRDMRFAHDMVPRLNDDLGARIDRVIGNVQPGRPVVRFNWFVTPIASRLFPEQWDVATSAATAGALAEDHTQAGALLWLRVEQQCFVRLPETGALAFTIHTYSDPLSAIAQDHASLHAIAHLLESYSEERLSYSGMLVNRPAILRWIADRLSA